MKKYSIIMAVKYPDDKEEQLISFENIDDAISYKKTFDTTLKGDIIIIPIISKEKDV